MCLFMQRQIALVLPDATLAYAHVCISISCLGTICRVSIFVVIVCDFFPTKCKIFYYHTKFLGRATPHSVLFSLYASLSLCYFCKSCLGFTVCLICHFSICYIRIVIKVQLHSKKASKCSHKKQEPCSYTTMSLFSFFLFKNLYGDCVCGISNICVEA